MTGTAYEQKAARYLTSQGLRILEMNYRTRNGEIDIIAKEPGGAVVFTEVKFRSYADAGSPEEAVDFAKQQNICRVCDYYRMQHHMNADMPIRFDVVAVEGDRIRWIQNAFEYIY